MRKLYSFYWDCSRMGEIEGLFVAEDYAVNNLMGKTVYFGEVLGKHSDIFGTIDEGDIKQLSVGELIGETIRRISNEESVSSLFLD